MNDRMKEENKMELEQTNAQVLEAPDSEEREAASSPPAWGVWEWIFLLSALLAAGCYFFAHFPHIFNENGHLPGIGMTLTQGLLVSVFLIAAKKKGRLRGKDAAGGWFLLLIALALGLCYALFADDALRLMNLPVTALATALALFSLAGANPLPPLSGKGLRLGLRHFLPCFFLRWTLPFHALKRLPRMEKNGRAQGLIVGLLLALPAVMIAAALLSSADAVFNSLLRSGFQSLDQLDGAAFMRLLYTLAGGLCLFSFLSAALEIAFQPKEAAERRVSPMILLPVLAMLSALYALFVYIQFRCLFFCGLETALEVGYAEYARSGFFQLVLLSVLTLTLILPCLKWGGNSRAVRVLCALLAALTGVIDYSAFFRMRLYIQAYGLSVLRVVTLWGMGMILYALIACLIKCLRPDTRVCPCLTALALCTWTLLQYGNVDRMIARYQVNAVNAGALQMLDVSYLASLSPDVLPELERISEEAARAEALSAAQKTLARRFPHAYDWSASWLHLDTRNAPSDGNGANPYDEIVLVSGELSSNIGETRRGVLTSGSDGCSLLLLLERAE